MLEENREAITRKCGISYEIVKIGIRDIEKERSVDPVLFTTDLDSIVNDPSIDVILELIGGTEPAGRLVERALDNGKHLVTANKELIAKEGSRLVTKARDLQLDLHYEAAVGGGIPIVQPLKHQLAGNDVLRMMGILNGTTNYILTKMQEEGSDFNDVLKEAQDKGYAEADPTNDVDGFDTMYKISILASIAFGKQVDVAGVHREGIRKITKVDMQYADLLGYRIKLLGVVDGGNQQGIRVHVHPTLLPKAHPLASVNDVYNALWLRGDFVGDLMFSGRGAGSDPTASAVVGDLIDVFRNIKAQGQGSALPYGLGMSTLSMDGLESAYYMRIQVLDRPRVLGLIATTLGEHNISLAAMEMRTVTDEVGEIVFLTHICAEERFMAALAAIKASPEVREVANYIRVA